MSNLELADIQGNVLLGYRLPVGRYTFLEIKSVEAGRRFVDLVLPQVTTSELWTEGKPGSTFNLAFTYRGLEALGVPSRSLGSFPHEFRDGMLARADWLYDRGGSGPDHWDPVWRSGRVHVWAGVHARDPSALAERDAWIQSSVEACDGVDVVGFQDAAALVIDGQPTAKEHFGHTDGYGNPAVLGAPVRKRSVRGRGKLVDGQWQPLATGEFVLGYRDEGQEVPRGPVPTTLSRNSTFMAYRKLQQNVGAYRRFIGEVGAAFPGGPALLAAKLAGRWWDGTPLALSPDRPDPGLADDTDRATDFRYAEDPGGVRCPLGSHMRRMNPRDGLGFDGKLTNRHRILRRGLPYGPYLPPGAPADDGEERGIIFMAVVASLERQFEFLQRTWMNEGNDFCQGDDPDPLVGFHDGTHKMVIQDDPADPLKRPPFVCPALPSFVETRGGDYFFVPALSALRLLAHGMDEEWI